MVKAREAFRTISEVAEWLDTPTHVLRFWETKFSQIRPVKGAGGRRYYRPSDMDLLAGIKQLLHEDGLTIKGTQKLLRDKGVKYVAMLGPRVDGGSDDTELSEDALLADQGDAVPDLDDMLPDQMDQLLEPVTQIVPPPLAAPAAPPQPLQTALPFDDIAPPRLAVFPAPPSELPDVPARLIGRAPLHAGALHAQAARIAPVLARLDAVRDRMRHG
ncbi:MerR family transcriptional regulator [Yoonia sp. TsM2_T14_4]|uniref:MerR family transcriptional regulator n=1 Tax=Yoonia sp. TsM2_T14_4 TaxID=3415141 RepID=UPI003C78E16A